MAQDRRYKIIKTVATMRDGKIIVLGIPYSEIEPGKGYITKFAFTTTIREKTMPNLFTRLSDNMPKYSR